MKTSLFVETVYPRATVSYHGKRKWQDLLRHLSFYLAIIHVMY